MDVINQDVYIKQLKDNWAIALMSKGVIVKVSLKMWRGNIALTPEDLGLRFVDEDMTSFAKKYIHLGTKKILPPTIVAQIEMVERRARNTLKTYSFDTVWGRFIPFTAFAEWYEANQEHKKDFTDLVKGLGSNYDAIVLSVKDDYRHMARDVWARLYPNDQTGPTASFTEDFVDRVISKIPQREDLVSSFGFDATYLSIPVPTLIQSNLDKASTMERERKIKESETELEIKAKQQIADEYVKRTHELIDGFLESTVYSMRENIADLCDAVLTSVGQTPNGCLTKSHVKRIHTLINNVNVLNFYDDEEIKRLMVDLRAEIDKFKGERNDDIVVSKLRKLVSVTSRELTPDDFNPMIQYLEP